MNYRGAWQQALSVLGRNTSRTAPVRNQSPALYRDLAGSCSKILPSAQAGLSGQMPAQTLSVMSVTGLQSGVGSPATTGPKRSVPFLRLARPKSPHQKSQSRAPHGNATPLPEKNSHNFPCVKSDTPTPLSSPASKHHAGSLSARSKQFKMWAEGRTCAI